MPEDNPEHVRVVREDLPPLPEAREPGFSRPRWSPQERNTVIVFAALVVALVAGIYEWNAKRYINCSDLLGTSWLGADIECVWRGSNLSLSFPKRDLPSYSGPVRQLYNGKEQVTVKGYVLHWDHENSHEAARGSVKIQAYGCRAFGPPHVAAVGGPTLIVLVIDHDSEISVLVTHHEFGLWDWLRGMFKY